MSEFTDLTNFNATVVSNATTTVVAAAANTKGIEVAIAFVSCHGSGNCFIQYGASTIILRAISSGDNSNALSIQNIVIPEGNDLILSATADDYAGITYRVK